MNFDAGGWYFSNSVSTPRLLSYIIGYLIVQLVIISMVSSFIIDCCPSQVGVLVRGQPVDLSQDGAHPRVQPVECPLCYTYGDNDLIEVVVSSIFD